MLQSQQIIQDCGAVAFPPIQESVDSGLDFQSISGYTPLGPANEGKDGRWRSPYVRNCTNFMTGSIGMKINGDHANAAYTGTNDGGQDLKSMVCDSFTQYNELELVCLYQIMLCSISFYIHNRL